MIATQQGGTNADTSAVTVSVLPPTLTQLVLAPASITLAPGGTSQFAVSGTWSDGSTTVPAVTYSATGGTIAAGGLYTAATAPGTFRVIATQQGGTKADTSAVTVSVLPPTLTQLVLAPASITLAPGGTGQFAVSGTWSDGSPAAPAATYSATGGTISTGGVYTAGATPGTFRVVATQLAGTKADTSTVTIAASAGNPSSVGAHSFVADSGAGRSRAARCDGDLERRVHRRTGGDLLGHRRHGHHRRIVYGRRDARHVPSHREHTRAAPRRIPAR